MSTLITGGAGVLGKELTKIFKDSLPVSHHDLNIINRNDVFNFFKKMILMQLSTPQL